jgi:hypothetical protein
LPQFIYFEASSYDMPADAKIPSEQLSGFTMHYNGHRESAYVRVNRKKTLPNTYMELAEYQGSSCRSLRHSKYQLRFIHLMGTP